METINMMIEEQLVENENGSNRNSKISMKKLKHVASRSQPKKKQKQKINRNVMMGLWCRNFVGRRNLFFMLTRD